MKRTAKRWVVTWCPKKAFASAMDAGMDAADAFIDSERKTFCGSYEHAIDVAKKLAADDEGRTARVQEEHGCKVGKRIEWEPVGDFIEIEI